MKDYDITIKIISVPAANKEELMAKVHHITSELKYYENATVEVTEQGAWI